jgi:hypothetical protein
MDLPMLKHTSFHTLVKPVLKGEKFKLGGVGIITLRHSMFLT